MPAYRSLPVFLDLLKSIYVELLSLILKQWLEGKLRLGHNILFERLKKLSTLELSGHSRMWRKCGIRAQA